MPPKKKSKGGEASSSSSIEFDRRRFYNAEASAIYTKLLEKSMQRERGMSQLVPTCATLNHARARDWEEFVKPPADAVLSLVREFYANLKVRHDDYRVKIRGRMVAFDSRSINSLYSMPDFEEDEFTTFMREPYPYDTIIETLCEPGAVWTLNNRREPVTFFATSMEREASNWYQFVAARLMPSGHISDVTKRKAALVYCIVTQRTVDAGRVIQDSILQAARGTSTVSMPHSSTITDLCQLAGITWDATEQVLQPKAPIQLTQPLPRDRRRRQILDAPAEAPGRAPTPPPQPQPVAPPVRVDRGQTVDERIDDLERRMMSQWRMTREHMAYMHDFTSVLAQRFPGSSSSDMPYPTPPAWSHRPVEEDEEDDDADMSEDDGNDP